MGSKDKNFLGHFWLGIFIQDLPVNLKQPIFSGAVRNGTKKRPVLSIEVYIQQHAGCCFSCTATQRQTMRKDLRNLNKEASGGMKLN